VGHTGRYVTTGVYRTCCTQVVTGRMTVTGQPVQGSVAHTAWQVVTGTFT
jgi:hypothetical protein